MPQHLPSPTRPRLFAGWCATCGRDIWEGDTARTDGEDLYCSPECAGEALTREVYARADGRDERVGEDALTLAEATEEARKGRRLSRRIRDVVAGWRRAAAYARREGWHQLALWYEGAADEVTRVLREVESPATTGHAAGDGSKETGQSATSAPSLPRMGG